MLELTLFLQLGLGYSPMRAGLTTIPWALDITVGAISAKRRSPAV
ncbi:hypothetical protein [Actinomadura hibisca]|nr:hypothetical protein [Actinomadura hibisca]